MLYKLSNVDSTQKYIEKNFSNLKVGDAVFAKKQTKGYGRSGIWESQDENIYFSTLQNYTPYTWLSIICAMHKFTAKYNNNTYIKIPNDIYFENKKLGGFIIEKYNNKLIIGIGINVYLKDTSNFTSLEQISKIDDTIDNLVQRLYNILFKTYNEDINFLNLYFKKNTNILKKNINFLDKKTNKIILGTVEDIYFENIIIDNISYNINQIKLINI